MRRMLLLAAAALIIAEPALAGDRTRKGSYSVDGGGSGSFESKIHREKGAKSRDTSWTNAKGKTGTHSMKATRDKAAGTADRQWQTTGPGGKSASGSANVTKTGEGSADVNASRTGFNGKTQTYEGTITRTEQGWESDGTLTNGQGKSFDAHSSGGKTEDGRARSTLLTGEDGKTASREVINSHDGQGGQDKSVTSTGPRGKTRNWGRHIQVEKEAADSQ